MSVTLKDVARHANVGVSAASYVLSGSGLHKVSEATRARIFAAATQLGYRVNHAGRMLHGGKSRSIGVLENNRSIPVFSELMQLVCKELAFLDYQTLYQVVDGGSLQAVIDEFISRGVEGIIIADYGFTPQYSLEHCPVPTVLFRSFDADVSVDIEAGAYRAARHLLEHGHRNIAYLYPDTGGTDLKLRGYRRALAEAGIEAVDSWLLKIFPTPHWREVIDRAVDVDGVTAICASCDDYAAKLMRYLSFRGIRVPDDVAVFGYDGMRYVEDLAVPLSTVIQPVERIAYLLCRRMMEKLESSLSIPPVILAPELYLGRSCGCRPQSKPAIDWSILSLALNPQTHTES